MKPVSGKELCRIVERKGWSLDRITGSHHIYKHKDHVNVVLSIPVHGSKDLKIGTQAGLMRTAGLREADLQ